MLGSVALNDVLGTPHPAQCTQQCPCISEVPEATNEARLRALEGRSAKKGVQDQGVVGRNKKEQPDEGTMICPPGKAMN